MGKTITLTAADGHTFSAYTAGPDDATHGIVVLQEIFGVNDHIEDMANTFAAAGYKTIAPALFDRAEKDQKLGYGPDDRKAGMALRGKVSDDAALADIAAAEHALGTSSNAIIGFCWGGTLAWLAATNTTTFDAASCWYGGGIAAAKDATPTCPVEMQFGETDGSIPPSDIEAIKAAQPTAEIYVYPGAGHGFAAPRDSYNAEAAELAQQRTLAFFAKNLK